LLSRWIRLFSSKKQRPKVALHTIGKHFNLKEIYDQLNGQYFDGKLDLAIGWFGAPRSLSKTRIVFGAYLPDRRWIKIHRILDQKNVPLYFVSFVIYHEMLHHVVPPISVLGKRRKVHHRAFVEREKKFSDYALAREFREKFKRRLFVFSR
jgi:hypothetical protein